MALRIFETQYGHYFLALTDHTVRHGAAALNDHIPELDALLLESSEAHEAINGWSIYRVGPGQFGNDQAGVLKEVATSRPTLPIYVVDYPYTKAWDFIDYIVNVSTVLAGLGLVTYGVWGLIHHAAVGYARLGLAIVVGSILTTWYLRLERLGRSTDGHGFTAVLQSMRTCLIPTPRNGIRDAVIAVKIEEYLLKQINLKGHAKPRVGIIYGAAHAGLQAKLKSRILRTVTVALFRILGYFGTSRLVLNTISEFQLVGGELLLRKSFNCNLF